MQVGMMASSIVHFVPGVKELTEHLFRLSSSAVRTAGLLRPSTATASFTATTRTTPQEARFSGANGSGAVRGDSQLPLALQIRDLGRRLQDGRNISRHPLDKPCKAPEGCQRAKLP